MTVLVVTAHELQMYPIHMFVVRKLHIPIQVSSFVRNRQPIQDFTILCAGGEKEKDISRRGINIQQCILHK